MLLSIYLLLIWFDIIYSSYYQIPTGELCSVVDTPFNFLKPTECEQALAIDGGGKPGLDHCFCLEGEGLKQAGR